MDDDLVTNLWLIYQLYGLSFLLLGFILYVLPKDDATLRFANNLWLLATFGVLHGMQELLGGAKLYNHDHWIVFMGMALLPISYLFLLEFGRRTLFRLLGKSWLNAYKIYGVIAVCSTASLFAESSFYNGLSNASRIFIGTPGALLTGWALFIAFRILPVQSKATKLKFWLRLASFAFVAYALLTPWLSSVDSYISAWLPTQKDFKEFFGVPIQLALALCAALASLAFFIIVRQTSEMAKNNLIQAQLRAENIIQALTQSESRLNEAQQLAHLGSWKWDLISGAWQWSDECFSLWGLLPQSVTPNYELFLKGVHPDDTALVEKCIQFAKRGSGFFECEHRIVRPDGSEHYVRAKGEAAFNDAGQAVRMVGTLQDVTELKQTEQELILSMEKAESASRAKSEFLSSMSHELRTPLNVVLGYAQLLAIDDELPLYAKEQAMEIETAGNYLLVLINDMIDLARIESGKLELLMKPISLDAVVSDSFTMLASFAQKYDIQISEDKCGSLTVNADYIRLRQVIVNLLSNAIKYNRPQGMVHLSCSVNEGRVKISVADTGYGISVDKQTRLFNSFDRLGKECSDVEGSGIGLVITKRIVEAMKGDIGFESIEGEGSVFWVELSI